MGLREAHLEACRKTIIDLKKGLIGRGIPEAKARIQCPACEEFIGFVADPMLAEKWVEHELAHCPKKHPVN